MSPLEPTSTHIGPNGRVPAIHSCGAPVTYRMLACRPSTRMSRLCARICASARSRRPVRKPGASGTTSVAIARTVRGVGIIGDGHVSVLGDDDDLLAAIAAGAVLPHHGFQDQD